MATIDAKTNDWKVEDSVEAMKYLYNCPVQDELFYQYNQYDRVEQRNACTLFHRVIILSSIFNQPITPTEEQELVDYAIKEYGFNIKGGSNSTADAARCATKWRNNKFPDKKAVYFQTTWFSDAFNLAIEKWLGVSITLQPIKWGSNKFFTMLKQWEIKMDKNLKVTQWHAISLWKGYKFRDSDAKSSVASCTKEVLEEMIKQKAVFPAVRVIIPLKSLTTLWEAQYKAIQKVMQANSEARAVLDMEDKTELNETNNYFRKKYSL